MKITIELDENLPDDEIRIHCRRMTEELQKNSRGICIRSYGDKTAGSLSGRFGVLCGCFGYFVF